MDGVLETQRYPQAQNLALVHVVASVFDGRIDMRSAGIEAAKRFNRGPGAGGAAGSMGPGSEKVEALTADMVMTYK